MFQSKKLSNGINLIEALNPNTNTVTILAVFKVGSKHETPGKYGIAHFLEHMIFKGTTNRPKANLIFKELDYIGATYNAFTAKEYTGFWIKTTKDNTSIALDILSDILINSTFAPTEIKNEKGAVIEEINMYEDTPMDNISSVLENLLYQDQNLGHDQLGSKKEVKSFTQQDLLDFYSTYYTSDNMIISVAGNFNSVELNNIIKQKFSNVAKSSKKITLNKTQEQQQQPAIHIKHKKTDQTNFSLAFRAFEHEHKYAQALSLLSVIMGGNSSSRLHERIREKLGLAYYIYSYTAFYQNVGYFAIQSGVGNNKYQEAITATLEEINRIKQDGISETELQGAKNYTKGVLSMSLESSQTVANFLASQAVLQKNILTVQEKFAKIDAVTTTDIDKVIKLIFTPTKVNLAVIGPIKKNQKLIKILNSIS